MTRTDSRRPRRALLAVAALTTVAASASVLTPAGAATRPSVTITRTPILSQNVTTTPSTATSVLRTWTAANEGPATVTLEQALATARQFDVISARPGTYAPYLTAMRQANPRLKVLVYMNGGYAQSSEGTKYPADWYALDALGRKIRSLNFGNYLMRPNSTGWVASRVAECKERLAKTPFDGCMIDMLSTAPLLSTYGTGVPINPATGQVWTVADWLAACANIATQVRQATGKYVMGNGLANGMRYWDAAGPSSVLIRDAEAGISEAWLRTAMQPLDRFPTETNWKKSVDAVADADARGRSNAVMVKLWAEGTQAQKDAWHKFALASFLLGANGDALFDTTYAITDSGHAHPWWSTDLGAPLGAYAKVGTVYSRSFEKGVVMVNPTKLPVTVNLGRTVSLVGGGTASTVTLPPSSGLIGLG